MMAPGDVVTIYEDPHTQRIPEGQVLLVERLDRGEAGVFHDDEDGRAYTVERWLVRFMDDEGDDSTYERAIRRVFNTRDHDA